jgi:DNA mismatch repair protein MutS
MLEDTKLTPMMAQYKKLKEEATDALLLFRMGDFYEAFYEDATILSECCSLTLTQRGGIAMSGIPWHSAEGYIDRLILAGHRVAIAEQIEAPQKGVALVKRKIVRTITPGTTTSSALLPERDNHFISCLSQVGSIMGLALCDLTTSEFKVIEFEDTQSLIDELYRLKPAEMLADKKMEERQPSLCKEIREGLGCILTLRDSYVFDHKNAYTTLSEHFQVMHLDGFGLKAMVPGISAAGSLLCYLKEELSVPTSHIRTLQPYTTQHCLSIDKVSQRHLELTDSLYSDKKHTLLSFIDRCQTAMGARLLRNWIKQPLTTPEEIKKRQDAIEKLFFLPAVAAKLKERLKKVKDLMRLMMKVSAHWATPEDLLSLRASFEEIQPIKELILSLRASLFIESSNELADLSETISLLHMALVDLPCEGLIFKKGYNSELDELTVLSENSKEVLAHYQEELRETTGAKTLKINYNRVSGYYIDVSKKQSDLLNEGFFKKQTLVNHDRFTTERLKTIEIQLLHAEERRVHLEKELFIKLVETLNERFNEIMRIASSLATLDVLLSLSLVSYEQEWQRPVIDNSSTLEIVGGYHPIVAAKLRGTGFIPNDTFLDGQGDQLMLITGPNMAGKSTYIRQVALIVILAQIGCFVPARKAHIGIIDKIFTRIGASDDLARGQSTFMVEMAECANILNNATDRSLVILDEIGRGTSTYDGLSIAWSIVEYLLLTEHRRAKTLFATHYFELTELEGKIKGIVNYHAAVEELDDQITFLYNICKGNATKSYGIHVAKLAHMPPAVISRATQILAELEEKQPKWAPKSKQKKEIQMTFFDI